MEKHLCDKCENGVIQRFGHIDNGICFKCNGTGKLPYDPTIRGKTELEDEWSEQERLDIEAEQELITKAEEENWLIANGFTN